MFLSKSMTTFVLQRLTIPRHESVCLEESLAASSTRLVKTSTPGRYPSGCLTHVHLPDVSSLSWVEVEETLRLACWWLRPGSLSDHPGLSRYTLHLQGGAGSWVNRSSILIIDEPRSVILSTRSSWS